jgi:hypothetical protein
MLYEPTEEIAGFLRSVWRAGHRLGKVIAVCVVILLVPYSLVVLLGSAMTAGAFKGGHDLSFEQFSELPWKGTAIRLYRTNGGATTDYGVVVRQERRLLPGIMLVRTVDSFYHCESIDVETTPSGIRLADRRSYCGAFPPGYRDYRLRSFVYF